ncbi:MAG TPA: DUF1697 domain-containing protein [Rickettsiales bacterium]|nr:DUF1697 domain-containing protein [Rickettsiales bacterium]
MQYAAFFRNVNLGRKNSPTRPQFEKAFLDAGAGSAASFLTNGTLVFTASSEAKAQRILEKACALLNDVCNLHEPAYIRSVKYLAELVATDPFASIDPKSVYACCASFLPANPATLPKPPFESKRKDVQVLHIHNADVLSICHKIGNTPGSPNAFLEKQLNVPATTRNWNTIVRLVSKFT